MVRVCQVTGKRTVRGNNRSHSMRATRRLFLPNIHVRRIWMGREVGFVKMKLSARGMRILDKKILEGEIVNERSRKSNRGDVTWPKGQARR